MRTKKVAKVYSFLVMDKKGKKKMKKNNEKRMST